MMATANGVDTQPARGVWLLENILGLSAGTSPDVPAVEPDTRGAKSIRELLKNTIRIRIVPVTIRKSTRQVCS